MRIFRRFQRVVICSILVPFIGLLLDAPKTAEAAVLQQGQERVQIVDWRVEGDVVLITYDLLGKPDIEYDVTIVLLREGSKSFRIVPRKVGGDVGKGKFAGTGRQIRWEYRKDVPEGFSGEDYYFEIAAEEVESGNMWLYLSLGAAAAVGGAVFFLSGKSSSSTPSGPTTLPDPPGRPF